MKCPKCRKPYLQKKDMKHVKTKVVVGQEYVHAITMTMGIIPTRESCYVLKKGSSK